MQKILTFDCYWTLLDTSPVPAFIGQTAQAHGLPGETARHVFSSYVDRLMYGEAFRPFDKLLMEALGYCDMELKTAVFSREWERLLAVYQGLEPFADVLDTLVALREKGYVLMLMSNTTVRMMERHLEKLGHLFDGTLVADDTRCYKPDLKFFQMAEEKFELSGREHCHIAKGYWWDIVPAAKMGWRRIWVNRDGLTAGRPAEEPYLTVGSLGEMAQLL